MNVAEVLKIALFVGFAQVLCFVFMLLKPKKLLKEREDAAELIAVIKNHSFLIKKLK